MKILIHVPSKAHPENTKSNFSCHLCNFINYENIAKFLKDSGK